jgi:methionyl-tRNA formyltransferase
MSLRLVFMGTPDFAATSLSELAMSGHEIAAVFTQPPRPSGRGQALNPSQVHKVAEAMGFAIETPQNLKSPAVQEALAAYAPDVICVVAYGQLLPQAVLDIPRYGCLNLHASLLPRWRGAAPIQRAIMAGDARTGVQIMRMEKGLDTGPILLSQSVEITPDDTGGSLHDRLAIIGAQLWTIALGAVEREAAQFTPQSEIGVTYAHKLTQDDRLIDWARPSVEIIHQIRGLAPSPGAFSLLDLGKGPQPLKVLRATTLSDAARPDLQSVAAGTLIDERLGVATGDGVLRLELVQPAGRPLMEARAFLAGYKGLKGKRFQA